MKTTTVSASTQTKNQEVETLLKEKEQEINSIAEQEAKDMASSGRPSETETKLSIYTQPITTAWQSIMEKTNQILGLENSKSIGATLKVSLNVEKAGLENDLPELFEATRIEKMKMREFDESHESVFRDWYYAKIGIIFMMFGELIINFRAFDLLTNSTLLSFISALGVGVVLFAMSLLQHYILTRVENKLKRNSFSLGIFLLVLAMLYALAQLRFTYLTIMDDSISEHMSPWIYVAISFLFYFGGVVLAFLFFPSKEQRKVREQYLTAKSTLDVLNEEIEKIKARILEIPKELEKKLTYHYSILVMGKQYERQIEALHQHSLALYIKANLSYRNTPTPPIFSQEMPELNKQHTHILNQQS